MGLRVAAAGLLRLLEKAMTWVHARLGERPRRAGSRRRACAPGRVQNRCLFLDVERTRRGRAQRGCMQAEMAQACTARTAAQRDRAAPAPQVLEIMG